MEETRTRFCEAIPASRRASSKDVSRSLCLPTPLVKKIFFGTMFLPNFDVASVAIELGIIEKVPGRVYRIRRMANRAEALSPSVYFVGAVQCIPEGGEQSREAELQKHTSSELGSEGETFRIAASLMLHEKQGRGVDGSGFWLVMVSGYSAAQAPVAPPQDHGGPPPPMATGPVSTGPVVVEWTPPALEYLSAYASTKESFTLDRSMLTAAADVLPDSDADVKQAINRLDGVSVHL